jgi:hypothetical protein
MLIVCLLLFTTATLSFSTLAYAAIHRFSQMWTLVTTHQSDYFYITGLAFTRHEHQRVVRDGDL